MKRKKREKIRKAARKALNLADNLEIIPEDDEFFSTAVKYKFDFDKDIILQSNILEACTEECIDTNGTEIIEECEDFCDPKEVITTDTAENTEIVE